jgi:hypothetical protein
VTSPFSGPTGWLIASRTRAHSLELPILGKYYFGHPDAVYRIFAATGYAFQRSWTSSSSVAIALEGATGNVGVHPVGGVQTPTVVGAVFGAGAARKLGPLVISPTLRYTRWGARFDGASRNQTDFLLAVWF